MSGYDSNAHRFRLMGRDCALVCAVFALSLSVTTVLGQGAAQQAPSNANGAPADAQHLAEIEQRLNEVTAALDKTQQTLADSLREIQKLRAELDDVRASTAASRDATETNTKESSGNGGAPGASLQEDVRALQEEQDAQQAEIKQHEQSKVETASKYPLRVTGLALFNAFANAGVVDDAELPTLALPRAAGASHGSNGATMRQTILGLEATGPSLFGARSSADVSIDFFGGVSANGYGYSASAGSLRMRQSQVGLDWQRTTVQAGYTGPLISPLSPTSYAMVAEPGMSASGNLWIWSPQLRVEERIPLSDEQTLGVEGGLIYPESPNYYSVELTSPVEASRRPGYEGRFSYRRAGANSGTAGSLVLGVGIYSSRQFYNSTTKINSWAGTADWQLGMTRRLGLSGEFYRGRAIGGLGGGAYKDVLTGIDTVTGLARTTAVATAGGWTQLKLRFTQTIEANAAYGLDDALSSSFDNLILSNSTNPLQLYARNSSVVGNLIFRPRTYLILSPEYRRMQSWLYTSPANVANIFTLSAGYQF